MTKGGKIRLRSLIKDLRQDTLFNHENKRGIEPSFVIYKNLVPLKLLFCKEHQNNHE